GLAVEHGQGAQPQVGGLGIGGGVAQHLRVVLLEQGTAHGDVVVDHHRPQLGHVPALPLVEQVDVQRDSRGGELWEHLADGHREGRHEQAGDAGRGGGATGAGRGPACGLLSPPSRAGSAGAGRAGKIRRPGRIGAATVHQGPPVGCCSAGTSREEASSNPVGVCQPRSMNIRSSARVIRAISTITTTVPRAPTTMGASPEASSLTAAGKISAWARMIPTGPASRLTRFWVSWITSTTRAITTTCSSGTMGAGRTTRRSTAPAMSTGRAAAAVRRNQEEPANR